MAQTQIDLYCGNGPAAWERLQETWPAVRRSFFLRVQTVRIFLTHLRARSALLAARQTNQPQHFLRHVERDARRIERERMPWAVPMAQLLRAGIAAARDRAAPCASLLLAAERGFADADMGLFAASVQRRRGERIGGDDGRRLIADADARMSAQGIRNPARMTALHFPVGPEANDLHHVYRGPPGRSY
jgi:hypothetical protein